MPRYKCLLLYVTITCAALLGEKCYAQKFSLLIGVDYPSPNTLDYTQADAIAFGDVLEKNFGFQTKRLTKPEETTKKRLLREFEMLKKNRYDQVIVFFSGHGIQDPNSKEVGYLLPVNFDSDDLLNTTIDMAVFQNLSKTIRAKQILFIVDACYSGIIGSFSNMDIAGANQYDNQSRSRQIMTAGRSEQTAEMYPGKELSAYTYYLTRGLGYDGDAQKIRADYDNDNEVTAWDLQSYVERKVKNQTHERQTPRIYNFTEDDGIFLFQTTWRKRKPQPDPFSPEPPIKKTIEPKAVPDELTNSFNMKFRYIKPGSFMMGNPSSESGRHNDEKQHRVTLKKGFYMQTTEVTQGQWQAVMGNNPSYFKNCGDNCPVENVSWNDVRQFIQKLNQHNDHQYRLPTEAEWEYAARDKSISAFENGWITKTNCEADPNLDAVGWYCGNSSVTYEDCSDASSWGGPRCAGTHRVSLKKANALRLYDMHGNVYEWVEDDYHDNYNEAPNDGSPWIDEPRGTSRVLRGGAWTGTVEACRSVARYGVRFKERRADVGFRIVLLPKTFTQRLFIEITSLNIQENGDMGLFGKTDAKICFTLTDKNNKTTEAFTEKFRLKDNQIGSITITPIEFEFSEKPSFPVKIKVQVIDFDKGKPNGTVGEFSLIYESLVPAELSNEATKSHKDWITLKIKPISS